MNRLILLASIASGLYYLKSRGWGRPGKERLDIQAILDTLDQIPDSANSRQKRVLSYLPEISAASKEFRIEKAVIAAIIDQESRGVWNARGRDDEYGLMQILCPTARMMKYTADCDGLLQPAINIWYSTKYVRYQLDRYADRMNRVSWAIAAYNAGTARRVDTRFSNQRYVDGVLQKRLPRYVYLINQLEIRGLVT